VTDVIGTTTRLTSYGFDLDNRVTSITTAEGTVNYAYDPATGFHTRTYTANSDVTYAPDALQRLKTVTVTKQNGVTLTTPLVTTYYYTAVGTIDHVTYPNGTETDYGYDTLNRLTNVTNKKGSTVLSSYVYTLENDGLRTGVTEQQLESDGTTSTVTKTWTYDAFQRLTQEAVTSSISANSYTDTYTMDLVGNRLTKVHTQGGQTLTINYTYNNNDQLLTESGSGSSTYSTTYGYDANGSLTSVTRTGSGAETDTYGYDLQNRLSSANISRTENGQNVTISASYTYDDSGPLANSVVTTTVGTGSPTTTTTQFLVDARNPTGFTQVLEEHTNGGATPSMSYILGLSVLGQTNGSGVTNYIMPDALGSTRLVTDASGSIVIRYVFDAYGNLLIAPIGILNPPTTRILYTGQYLDPALLEYYLRARFYDPASGRFTQADPSSGQITLPWTLHKYIYANGNPLLYFDPSGRDGLAGFLVGFAIANQIRNVKIAVDLAIFDAVWAVVRGVQAGMTSSEIWASFIVGQLVGFGLGLLVGKLLRGFSNLWENGIVIRPRNLAGSTSEFVGLEASELARIAAVPISRGDGLRRVIELRRLFGVSGKKNIAYAEIDLDLAGVAKDLGADERGLVLELRAVSGESAVEGFLPPPRFFIFEYPVGRWQYHSEAILLENLAQRLSPDSFGTIRLFSERPICDSCWGIIQQFKAKFPRINLITSGGVPL
jgi:RHS repeat-associated protein